MTSVAILGAGAVGVACAGPLLQHGLISRLELYDRDGDKARGEALDFHHAAPLLPECTIEGGSMELDPGRPTSPCWPRACPRSLARHAWTRSITTWR